MYRDLTQAVQELKESRQLIVVPEQVDPYLEMAAIHRRVFSARGPAILYTNIKGCNYSAVSNLFGTLERGKYLLRQGYALLEFMQKFNERGWSSLKEISLSQKLTMSLKLRNVLPRSLGLLTKKRIRQNYSECQIEDLPQIQCWPMDGGSYILLPQVYSEDPVQSGFKKSNLGMYRIQMQGKSYQKNREIGLHYQTHRGLGIHHQRAIELGKPLKVSIFVGGSPLHFFSAIFPAPEFLPEVFLAGLLNGRRWRYFHTDEGWLVAAEADFCILGEIGEGNRVEGPFGDHLGYYSLEHPFPYLVVKHVYAKRNAIWPFTVVGRPPQEDSIFGKIIHELTDPFIHHVLPGVRAIHAVDESGVHPLLLALGRETYTPYLREKRPQEILTIAHRILGFGQLSLAKFLLIMDEKSFVSPKKINQIDSFLNAFLQRTKLSRDLHFICNTTIDTLDYSGDQINQGSKLIWAAPNQIIRTLIDREEFQESWNLSNTLGNLLAGYGCCWVTPGVLAVNLKKFVDYSQSQNEINILVKKIEHSIKSGFDNFWDKVPLLILADDAQLVAANFKNFLWIVFTRTNPSHDIYGAFSTVSYKHWSCQEPLLMDARIKSHHSPILTEDPKVERRVDRLATKGKSLAGII